jgi:hypothetical protein
MYVLSDLYDFTYNINLPLLGENGLPARLSSGHLWTLFCVDPEAARGKIYKIYVYILTDCNIQNCIHVYLVILYIHNIEIIHLRNEIVN